MDLNLVAKMKWCFFYVSRRDTLIGSPLYLPITSNNFGPSKQNSDEIRLCVDMHNANKAITRERHILPTIDELIHDLSGSSVYSKLDLRSGYH
jgi:hypothetical protein